MDLDSLGKIVPALNTTGEGISGSTDFTDIERDLLFYVDGSASFKEISRQMRKGLEDLSPAIVRLVCDRFLLLPDLNGDDRIYNSLATEYANMFGTTPQSFSQEQAPEKESDHRGEEFAMVPAGEPYSDFDLEDNNDIDQAADSFDDIAQSEDLVRTLKDQERIEEDIEKIEEETQKSARVLTSVKGFWTLDSLFILIKDIYVKRKTGRLQIGGGDGEEVKNLFFSDGRLLNLFSKPFRPEECLGRILQRAGKLEKDEVIDSLREVFRSGRPQGEKLVQMGKIHHKFLNKALQYQAETKLKIIFEWEQGNYDWLEVTAIPSRVVDMQIPVVTILFNLMWKHVPDDQIAQDMIANKEKWVGVNDDPPFDIEDLKFGKIFAHFWKMVESHDIQLPRLKIISNLKKEQTPRMIWILGKLGLILFMDDTRQDKVQARIDDYKDIQRTNEKRSAFEVLGVHWSANSQMVRDAYQYTKDRFRMLSESASDSELYWIEQILSQVEAAYDIVKSRDERRTYRVEIYDDTFIEANADIFRQKAESFLFTKQEYLDALKEAESALEILEHSADIVAVAGLSQFLLHYPKTRDEYEQGRKTINRARQMNPKSEMVNICLGMMCKKEKLNEKAKSFYKQALDINPRNKFAKLEIREIETGKSSEEADRQAIIKEFLDQRGAGDKQLDEIMAKKRADKS